MDEEPDGGTGVPEWVVTYGDMMSLLLTFFILLVSLSELKQENQDEKYQAILDSLRRRFGYNSARGLAPGPHIPRNSNVTKIDSAGRARRTDTMNGGADVRSLKGPAPRVRAMRQADQLTIGGTVYFDENSSELTESQKRDLQLIALELGGKPQKVEIRGHTSGRPLTPDSPYTDQWDLAYARCHSVMEFLVSVGLKPERLRIGVVAQYEPAQLSNDPLELRKNARVEVFMLNEFMDGFDQPKSQDAADYDVPAR